MNEIFLYSTVSTLNPDSPQHRVSHRRRRRARARSLARSRAKIALNTHTPSSRRRRRRRRRDRECTLAISHAPMVGIVVTISPSFNLYKIVVFPAASRPTYARARAPSQSTIGDARSRDDRRDRANRSIAIDRRACALALRNARRTRAKLFPPYFFRIDDAMRTRDAMRFAIANRNASRRMRQTIDGRPMDRRRRECERRRRAMATVKSKCDDDAPLRCASPSWRISAGTAWRT